MRPVTDSEIQQAIESASRRKPMTPIELKRLHDEANAIDWPLILFVLGSAFVTGSLLWMLFV